MLVIVIVLTIAVVALMFTLLVQLKTQKLAYTAGYQAAAKQLQQAVDEGGTGATPAYPDEMRQFIEDSHAATDTDDDGIVQRNELHVQMRTDFDESDVNGDGVITLDDVYNENVALAEGVDRIDDLNHHMPGFDHNTDGQIEFAEYVTTTMQRFAHMDADRDDEYTLEEAHDFHSSNIQ